MDSDELTPSETDAGDESGAESRRDAEHGTDPTGTDRQQTSRGVASQAAFGDGIVDGGAGARAPAGEESVEERGGLAHEGEAPAQGERD
jgi:hypothetical protein